MSITVKPRSTGDNRVHVPYRICTVSGATNEPEEDLSTIILRIASPMSGEEWRL
jgi:hypothetical protein